MNDISVEAATGTMRGAPPAAAAPVESLRLQQVAAAAQRFAERRPEREQAEQLKQRGLFLAVDDPGQIAERAARRLGRPDDTAALTRSVAAVVDTPAPTLAAAFERVIGRNDLLPIAYFARGAAAAQAVGRVITTDGQGHDVSYGTAFLVAPNVILTNHHVLPDAATAALSHVQFNYQFGTDGQMERFEFANIDPSCYVSDQHLDFALAALADGAGGSARPVLPLIASSAKIINGESVSIIQHPGAEPKQVALRDNHVVDILPDFLHYATDTREGSSGSPVMNDQWEVVALHHAGVPQTDASGALTWVANEGIRISRIVAHLKGLQHLPAPVGQMVATVLAAPAPHVGKRDGGGTELQRALPPGAARASDQPAPSARQLTLPAGPYVTEINIRIRPGDGLVSAQVDGNVESRTSQWARSAALDLGAPAGPAASGPESAPLVEQLEAGDVLLYNGTSLLSEAIKFFTNSDVSHAGIFLGGPAGGLVGEAVSAGVIRDARDQSFAGHNWVMVHRLRATTNLGPVIARANFYLDQSVKYAYPQLVFLAILLLVKRVRPSGMLGRMVSAVTTAAAEALNRFLESGQNLMICSEFVYRAFDEADSTPASAYHLQIPGVAREGWSAQGGIEAGSILAQLQAHPDLLESGFGQAAESARAALPLNQAVLEARASELLADYLAEQRYGRPSRKAPEPAFALDQQTAAAVSRFAIAVAALRHRASGDSMQAAVERATQERQPGALPPVLATLLRSPADFVTPADLRQSPSLVQIGRAY